MKRKTVIRNLEACREWLKARRKKPTRSGDPWEAKNIMIGCIRLMNQAGRRVGEWLGRRDGQSTRGKVLKRIRDRYNKPNGFRVLDRLITLTIETLRSCSWRTDFWTGPLPTKYGNRTLSEAQKRAMQAGRTRKRNAEETARKARFQYEATPDTAPLVDA